MKMSTTLSGIFLTVKEASARAGISEGMIQKYCREGRIKAERIGRRSWIMRKSALDAFAKRPRKRGNPNFLRKS